MKTNFMIYVTSDKALDTFDISDLEEIFSLENEEDALTILVRYSDTSSLLNKQYVIDNGLLVEGESFKGSHTLEGFLRASIEAYPSDKNTLILWTHGESTVIEVLPVELDEEEATLEVSELTFPLVDQSINYTDLLSVPLNVNIGLENSNNDLMQTLLGNPRTHYSKNCSAEGPTGKLRTRIAWGKNVGPFNVSGFDLAVDSLREIFSEASLFYPDLVAGLKSSGMLCCRYIRGSNTSISNHSWGAAIDIRVDGILDSPYNKKVQYGLTLLAPIFNKHGWFWGGTFRNEDGMHFEVGKAKMLAWQNEGKLFNDLQHKPSTFSSLRLGSRGKSVLALQQKLNRLGYELIEDGIFGHGSHVAVMDFQIKKELSSDGIVGKGTMSAIDRALKSIPIAKSRTESVLLPVTFGMKSRSVQIIQEFLNRYGLEVLEDGEFDKLMFQSVLDFQRALGLMESGVIDDETWKRLQIQSKAPLDIKRRHPLLTLGDANSEVFLLQSYLDEKGYNIPNDGYFGLEMYEAVKKLQEKNALTVTGKIDEQTHILIKE